MRTVLQLIKKNFVILFREKSSVLLLVLGPMFIIFLLGIAFDNTNTYSLNVGTYSAKPTQTVDFFVSRLREQFHVVRLEKEGQCTEMIKEGTLHACISFPDDFSLQEKGKNELFFYVDYGRINLVYLILDTLTSKLSAQSKDISVNLTNVLLDKLDHTRKEIFVKRPILSEIGKKNKEITEQLAKITREIEHLDLSLTPPNLAKLEALSDGERVDQSVSSLKQFITLTRASINDASRNAAPYTNPDGSNQVMEDLRKAKGALKALEGGLENELAPVKSSFGEIKAGLTAVAAHIAAAQTKMNEFDAVKASALHAGKELTQKTTEIIADVQALQATFETIDQDIGSIQIRNAADIVNPVSTTIKAVNAAASHLNYVFPSLFVLVIMFISILLATTLVVMEKNSPAFFRNAITPVSDLSFLLATWLTCLLIVGTQAFIMLFVAGLLFSIPLVNALLPFSLGLFLTAAFFSVAGMVIGYVFHSDETATIAGISLGTLFLFFSNVIIPLESMPASVYRVVQYSPYLLGEQIIRKVAFYKLGLSTVFSNMLFLLSYTLLLFLFVYTLQTASRKHFAHRWAYVQKKKMMSFVHLLSPSKAQDERQMYSIPDVVLDDQKAEAQEIGVQKEKDTSKKTKLYKKRQRR